MHCVHRHISYAKKVANYFSDSGACLERQNKKPKNCKGVVAIPLMFGSFRHASYSVKQYVCVFYLTLINQRMQYRKIELLKMKTKISKLQVLQLVATHVKFGDFLS